jgi:Flp pilus assembly protein TadD
VRAAVCLILCVAVTGCSGRRFVNVTPDYKKPSPGKSGDEVPGDSLETFMAKVRKISEEARPDRPAAATVEGNNPSLAAAVAAAEMAPSPETYRAAAEEYRRFGIFDKAFRYIAKATAMDPRDATTYDSSARLWRDSGMPHVALGDAYRATYFAPRSPVAHNTLGTIFQALGRRQLARAEYQRALQLEPSAAYALNNLCYGWILDKQPKKAVLACENALKVQPGLAAAHNNLGLAHAANGDMAAARAAFARAGDKATELYNTGIVQLAQRDYDGAVDAFESAYAARPTLVEAVSRARQARAAAAQSRGEE